jgi:hypothetical protein
MSAGISYPDDFVEGACPRYSAQVLEKAAFDVKVAHPIGGPDDYESVENIGALDRSLPLGRISVSLLLMIPETIRWHHIGDGSLSDKLYRKCLFGECCSGIPSLRPESIGVP